ncbi:MAG: hypothetical protein IM572_11970, partial [Chitinophagaceae bacterium]|nr:hypothetical protein [Chitinophagaceae bacterium]
MFKALKGLFGFSEEDELNNQRQLAALSPEEIEQKVEQGRLALIKEYKLKTKPAQLVCGVVGMQNLGNTCFMASALQCLINTRVLTMYFLTTEWEESINPVSSITKGKLACEYFVLLKKVWCEQNDYVNPSNVKNAITKVCKAFAGYSQQDSQEFLSFFLDALHEDLNQVIIKPYEVLKDYTGQPIEVFSEERFQSHLRRNRSFVIDAFHGQFHSKLQCSDCQYVSASCDPFDMISMTIPCNEKRILEGYFVPLTYESTIKEFKFHCNESTEMSKVLSHLAQAADNIDPLFLAPLFYLRSKIIEKPPHPDNINVKNAINNEGLLFVTQVFDPTTMRLVFGDRTDIALEQLKNRSEFTLRIFMFENETMIGIEREVVVPEGITSMDAHLLVYLIYRSAFIGATIKDFENHENNKIESREQLLEEFKLFWPDADIEARKALFMIKINSKSLIKLDDDTSLFKRSFDNRLNIEVHLNTKKFLNSLKLKKCSRMDVSNLLVVEKPLNLQSCFENFTLEERLDKENMWYCPKCKEHKQAYKKMTIAKLPDIMIIHLKRFRKEMYKNHFVNYKKVNSLVEFPLRNFDVSPFTNGKLADTKYSLY